MSQISINQLTFGYDGSYDNVFEEVSFVIDSSWKLGLTGRNGRGKTTLLKLLMGQYEYRGEIHASVLFDYFPFVVADEEQNTIDVIEAIDPAYELWKVCRELNLLEVDPEVLYRPFATLSKGEQTKTLLGLLFSRENHFLLIDEPTNHLDMEARETVKEYLKKKKGFILVSHDQHFLDGCIDHVMAINPHDIQIVQGNFTNWYQNKERQDASELAENEKLKKDITRLTKAAARTEKWSDKVEQSKKGQRVAGLRPDRGNIGHKAAKMMKRALTIEQRANEAVEDKKKLLKNIEQSESLKLFPLHFHKDTLAVLEDVSVSYGEKPVLEHLDLKIRSGQRIMLQGKNGCGKSTILKLVLGELKPAAGIVQIPPGLVISYVSQDVSHLKGDLAAYAREYQIEESLFKALLRKLDFSRAQFDKPIEALSSGQKKKVMVARSLCEQAHLYVWDEPLNYIDLFSRRQIEELILTFQPTMLLVEHDKIFTEKIHTDIVKMS